MKFVAFPLLLTLLYCTILCSCTSTSIVFSNNVEGESFSLDDILKYVEELAKQLEESIKEMIKDIEECFPLDAQSHRRNVPSNEVVWLRSGKAGIRSSASSSSESSSLESNLWNALKELMMEAFETVRDIIKRILGIEGAARLFHVMSMHDGFDQQFMDEKVERFIVYAMELLKNSAESDAAVPERLEDLLVRIKKSFNIFGCLLRQIDIDRSPSI
uniref:Putative conserved secreted protein n=1 Tax=Aedes albopictus TaxID=7160 RepID=A0A1W7R762_AEDAL